MEKIVIELEAKLDKALQQIEELKDEVKGVGEESKKTQKATKSLAQGFKGIGLAMKAMGIGLIMKAFDKFVEILMRNQKAVDLLNTAMGTIEVLFNDLIEVADPLFDILSNLFSNPLQSIKDFGTSIKEYGINAMNQFLSAVGHVGKAVGHLFKLEFDEAKKSVQDAGRDMVDAMVGVEEGGVEVVNEALEKTLEYAKEIPGRIAEATAVATKLTEAQKESEMAEVRRAEIQLKYQRREEKLRQLRDDEFRNIGERIQANNDLLKMLEEQTEEEAKQIEKKIHAARLQVEMNASQDNMIALKQAELEMTDLLERLEGQRSEALMNVMGLQKEMLDIKKAEVETEQEIQRIEGEAQLEMMTNSLEQMKARMKLAEDEYNDKRQQLDDEILMRASAGETETAMYKEMLNQRALLDAQYEKDSLKGAMDLEKAKRDFRIKLTADTFNVIGAFAKEGSDLQKGLAVAQATMNTYESVTAFLTMKPASPFNFVQAGIALATGIANVRNILSTDPMGGAGGGGAPGGSVPQPTMPNVAVLGGGMGSDPSSQIAESIERMRDQPVKAYVVADDVTSAQAYQRRIARNRVV